MKKRSLIILMIAVVILILLCWVLILNHSNLSQAFLELGNKILKFTGLTDKRIIEKALP